MELKQFQKSSPEVVLLRGIQLTLQFNGFNNLYFLIHFCHDNTRKVRAPNAERRTGAPHMNIGLMKS
jgi:hypothetical protein